MARLLRLRCPTLGITQQLSDEAKLLDHRAVIMAARIEKLSAKEIGERMGRTENAVHLLLGRALKRLAQELKF